LILESQPLYIVKKSDKMKVSVTTEKRRFDLKNLSELEGLVLRTLLNLNEEGLRKSLAADAGYWSDEATLEEALLVAIEIRNKIFKAVDYV